MSKFIHASVLLCTLSVASAAVGNTVDFEAFTETTTIAAGTDYRGITFDQNVQVGAFSFLDGPATDGFIARATAPLGGAITGFFSGVVSMLRLGAGDVCCDVDTVTLSGYDGAGNLVDSSTFSAPESQFLTIAGAGIASFRIEQSSGGFDNLTFDLQSPSEVPLPASLPLMLAGLGGLGIWRRRKS
ncbi:MAG: VPLPA-CTERM sorting domain-containing protein [Sulfitobacter sp.]